MTKSPGIIIYPPETLQVLKTYFEKKPYLTPSTLKLLSKTLSLTKQQLIYWFQNERRRQNINLNESQRQKIELKERKKMRKKR